MQKTVNYNLNKPNYSDQYDLRHWNDNMDIIDTQMKSEETSRINGLGNLQQALEGETQSRTSGDTTLQNNINLESTARTNADTAIRNELGNGTLMPKKAECDSDNNVIKDTYATKGELETETNTRISSYNTIRSLIKMKSLTTRFYSKGANTEQVIDDMEVDEMRYVNFYGNFSSSQSHPKSWLKLPAAGTYFVMSMDGEIVYYDSSMNEQYYSNSLPISGGNYICVSSGDRIDQYTHGVGHAFLVYRVS